MKKSRVIKIPKDKNHKNIQIAFSYPDPGSVKSVFHQSVLGMTLYETSKDPKYAGEDIDKTRHLGSFLHQTPGCYVSINRSKIAAATIGSKHDTHILMIDPDISFAPNILDLITVHLVSFPFDIDILSGRVNIGNGYPVFYNDEFGGRVQQIQPFYGVKSFSGVGTGIICISKKCLVDLVKKEGHNSLFMHKFLYGREHGDDFSFCETAKKHGYKLYGAWAIKGEHLKETFVASRYPETLDEVAPGFGKVK